MPSDPRVLPEQFFSYLRDLCVFVVKFFFFLCFLRLFAACRAVGSAEEGLFPSPISYPIHRDRLSADRPES